MANNKTNNTQAPGLLQVKLTETEEFNNVISTLTTTSSLLEKTIADFFSGVFSDFEGCKITKIGDTLKCKLYFKPCPNKTDGLYAVKVRGEEVINKRNQFGLVDMVNIVNQLSLSKQFELEQEAKEILAEYLIIPPSNAILKERYDGDLDKNVKIRLPKSWDPYTEEVTDVVNNSRFQNPLLGVITDLVPIVAKLYGKKDKEEVKAYSSRGIVPKDRYQYSADIVKILDPKYGQFIIEIKRIDIKEMNKLTQIIGYGMVQGNIIMTRK